MKILIANLGSTSFKYRLFDMDADSAVQLASGGFERVTDYTACIEEMLEGELTSQLGYESYQVESRNSGNSRNGHYTCKMRTSGGDAEIKVPST